MKTQQQLRIENNLQCPECYGVQIDHFNHAVWPTRFVCHECGCTWHKNFENMREVPAKR